MHNGAHHFHLGRDTALQTEYALTKVLIFEAADSMIMREASGVKKDMHHVLSLDVFG